MAAPHYQNRGDCRPFIRDPGDDARSAANLVCHVEGRPFAGYLQPRSSPIPNPWVATILTGSVATVIAGLFPIGLLGELVSIGTLLAFSLVCGGIFRAQVHRPRHSQAFSNPSFLAGLPFGSVVLPLPDVWTSPGHLGSVAGLDGARNADLLRLRPKAFEAADGRASPRRTCGKLPIAPGGPKVPSIFCSAHLTAPAFLPTVGWINCRSRHIHEKQEQTFRAAPLCFAHRLGAVRARSCSWVRNSQKRCMMFSGQSGMVWKVDGQRAGGACLRH